MPSRQGRRSLQFITLFCLIMQVWPISYVFQIVGVKSILEGGDLPFLKKTETKRREQKTSVCMA